MRYCKRLVVLEHAQAGPAKLTHELVPTTADAPRPHGLAVHRGRELQGEFDEEAVLLNDVSPEVRPLRPSENRLAMSARGIDAQVTRAPADSEIRAQPRHP